MKKRSLLFVLFLISFFGYSQTEGFEGGIPGNWTVFDNGVGTAQSWGITTTASNVYNGSQSAQVLLENIGQGNTSEDWLVTPLETMPTNPQLRFFARSLLSGDRGTKYQIWLSSTSATGPKDKASYTLIKEYTSLELSDIATVYKEQSLTLPAVAGEKRYIAFVRSYTQPTTATGGDRWLLDDVSLIGQCLDATQLGASSVSATTAILTWAYPSGSPKFDVEYGLQGFTPGTNPNSPGLIKDAVSGLKITGLTPTTTYEFYVRAKCSSGFNSPWTGPYFFISMPIGVTCEEAIAVSQLPFQINNDTANYGDLVDDLPGVNCGATPSTINYFAGNDVFYSFTPTTSGSVSVTMIPEGPNSSLFVYSGCANVGVACYGGVANPDLNPRVVTLNATAGTTYTIVISSSSVAQTNTVGYTLLIQNENCLPKPSSGIASNITQTTADLSWSNLGTPASTSWQVKVQPFGTTVPTGDGDYTKSNPYNVSGLTAGVQYQFWVRVECSEGSGVYSSWAGPYPFNTKICSPTDACQYTFRMTDSANNGWNGALMEVRQKGIVLATIGSTYTSGAGPVDVSVSLCKDVPFDLYWSAFGTKPQECIVTIINSFGQTLFSDFPNDLVVYADTANCTIPVCEITPTNLSATVTTNSAVLSWDAPATTLWDIYVVTAGSPAPEADTAPTFTGVSSNPFTDPDVLLADTPYDFYVRVHCTSAETPSTGTSVWSASGTFNTVPTCKKPTALGASAITTTSATLSWTPALVTDNKWDILLVPSTTFTLPAQLPTANPSYPGQIVIPGITTPSPYTIPANIPLTPATIYFYYIRTVCSSTNVGSWAGPYAFNTETCDDASKCTYKFVVSSDGPGSWLGQGMQVRQNGIVVATIGGYNNIPIGTSITVPVALCPGVPFDLYWYKWSGFFDADKHIAIQIQSPFSDVLYTKLAGEGTEYTVLYSSVGNCTPPTCVKPKNLTVANITPSTVDLSWTPVGSETKWEVYVVPAGSPLPSDGPVTGIAPYYIANTNTLFTVPNLDPSTKYEYYVRAICSGTTDVSTWTVLGVTSFITKPANDECSTALALPVNPTRVCNLSASGNTLGATGSLPLTAPVCSGTTDDDIWFSFVATAKTHQITISDVVGVSGTTAINHTVYSGSDCNSLTQMYCSSISTSIASNLVIGNTYKIRVYTNGSVATQTATFTICVTTLPNPTNDECSTAIPASVNNDMYCAAFTSGSLTGATPSAVPNTCVGTADDDVWFSFVATAQHHYFELKNIEGTTSNLNHAIYSGTCGSLTKIQCSAANSLSSDNATFVIGQTYYVRVWSNSAASQDLTFDLCIGVVLPPITTSTTQYTNQQLVEDVLLKTKCASVTNVTSSTGTNFGTVNGIGYFNKSSSGFPYSEGIILSTGNALSAPGPNTSVLSAGTSAWPGDADLEKIVLDATGAGMSGKNASILEFDFVPLSSQISFNFSFASEEYGSQQCNFSDAFAFILTGKDGIPKNLAIVPGGQSQDIISVVTVRDQLYNSGCPSVNPEYFGTYYLAPGIAGVGAPINFNGITASMTAHSTVNSGEKYHIKMVIADRSDFTHDSAVFLEGGSFNIGNVDFGPDLIGANSLCSGETKTLSSGLDPALYSSIFWTKDGTNIPNETGANYTVKTPGEYAVWAQYGGSTSCIDMKDSIKIDYYQEAALAMPNNLKICNGVGTGVFDLTQNTAVVLVPFSTDTTKTHTATYFLSQADADANVNEIADPSHFSNTTNPQTVYMRVNNDYVSCYQTTSFSIVVQDLSPKFTLDGALTYCPQQSTTITVLPTNNSFDPTLVSYSWKDNQGNEIGTASSMVFSTAATYGDYTVTVNNSGCTTTASFTIANSNKVWDVTFLNTPYSICPGQSIPLSFSANNFDINNPSAVYTWTLPNNAQSTGTTVITNQVGVYSLDIDIYGCTSTKQVSVVQNTDAVAIDFLAGCDGNNYKIQAIPANGSFDPKAVSYVWSGPEFATVTDVPSTIMPKSTGTYTVKVTTADDCFSEKSIEVTDTSCLIQKGISPNGDGLNESFLLNDVSKLEIFNRYGLKVYSCLNYTNQWHGQTDEGHDLPDGTYYYVIERNTGERLTGWIYINR